jgi:hypothetical protein
VDDVEPDARHRQVGRPAQLPDRRGDVGRAGGDCVGLGDVGDGDELDLVDLEDPGRRPVARWRTGRSPSRWSTSVTACRPNLPVCLGGR